MSRYSRSPLTGRDFSLPLHFLQKHIERSPYRAPQQHFEEEVEGSHQSKGIRHEAGVGQPGHSGHMVLSPERKNQEKT